MGELTETIREWLSSEGFRTVVLPRVVAGLLIALVLGLWAWLRRGPGALAGRMLAFGRARRRRPAPMVHRYLDRLQDEVLDIRHSWLKEEQNVADVLVPVALETDSPGSDVTYVTDLRHRLFRRSDEGSPARFAVLGGPGTGKSVALRLLARETAARTAAGDGELRVPVFLTFGDLRDADDELEEALARSLHDGGFHPEGEVDGGDAARRFVREALPRGEIVVLCDALDELALADRSKAAKALTRALKRHPQAPAVFSCRTAAWTGQLGEVPHRVVRLADLERREIREFVGKWRFDAPKSAQELLATIEGQPHVGVLAKNPLLLTIVAFLYSHPKYRLPDNRALFYEVCSRALLEEWDHARNPDDANRFDRPHKEALLGQVAWEHLQGPAPEQDLQEPWVVERLAEGMDALGLKPAESTKLLREVRLRSGLLVRLPPSGLRFPHQTFLEFFAARHLVHPARTDDLLTRYEEDQRRWREVLLLFCGLSEDVEATGRVVRALLDRGDVDLAVAALAEARTLARDVAEAVLAAADDKLAAEPTKELADCLGYVSANPRSALAERAAGLVRRELFKWGAPLQLEPEVLNALLLAALRHPDEEATRYVVKNAAQLNLLRVLPALGSDALLMSTKVLAAPGLDAETKRRWLAGLGRAEAAGVLLELATLEGLEREVRDAAAWQLGRLSDGRAFWAALDAPEAPRPPDDPAAEEVWTRWGWPFDPPTTECGRRLACYLASRLAVTEEPGSEERWEGFEPRLAFLACFLSPEREGALRTGRVALSESVLTRSPARAACFIWRRTLSRRWGAWFRDRNSPYEVAVGAAVLLGWLVSVWSLVGVVGYLESPDGCGDPVWLAGTWTVTVAALGGSLGWLWRENGLAGVVGAMIVALANPVALLPEIWLQTMRPTSRRVVVQIGLGAIGAVALVGACLSDASTMFRVCVAGWGSVSSLCVLADGALPGLPQYDTNIGISKFLSSANDRRTELHGRARSSRRSVVSTAADRPGGPPC